MDMNNMRYLQLPYATPQEQSAAGLGPAQECEAGRHELQDMMARMITGHSGRPDATRLVLIYYRESNKTPGFKILFSFAMCQECADQMQENLKSGE